MRNRHSVIFYPMFVITMPLIYLAAQPDNMRLAIWEFVKDDFSPLEKWLVDTYYSDAIQGAKLPKRKREIIGTKLLKRTLGIPPLSYESSGKPVTDKGHVSISHSENLVGIIHADFLVGLDLQKPSEKLYRVRSKFCNKNELENAKKAEDELINLTLVWSTKEAVYKMFGKNISFSKDMSVKVVDDKRIVCQVSSEEIKETIFLNYFWLRGQCVVYRITDTF